LYALYALRCVGVLRWLTVASGCGAIAPRSIRLLLLVALSMMLGAAHALLARSQFERPTDRCPGRWRGRSTDFIGNFVTEGPVPPSRARYIKQGAASSSATNGSVHEETIGEPPDPAANTFRAASVGRIRVPLPVLAPMHRDHAGRALGFRWERRCWGATATATATAARPDSNSAKRKGRRRGQLVPPSFTSQT
jgi:hypothetical protein